MNSLDNGLTVATPSSLYHENKNDKKIVGLIEFKVMFMVIPTMLMRFKWYNGDWTSAEFSIQWISGRDN